MPNLILASSSPYRKALLQRLGLEFQSLSPAIDESTQPGETARALVERLSTTKAQAILVEHPEATVIGSDQVAILDGEILTKPHTVENARRQLTACSGREVAFLTGLCVGTFEHLDYRLSITRVNFRQLSSTQIDFYIQQEMPLDCAGSFKCEGLGIALFTQIQSDDPTSLIGLPLIELSGLLAKFGIYPLGT